jgi:hypothetical protein
MPSHSKDASVDAIAGAADDQLWRMLSLRSMKVVQSGICAGLRQGTSTSKQG